MGGWMWLDSGANPKELEDLKQSNADLTRRLLDATTRENQAHLKLVELNDQLRRKEDECKRREEKCVSQTGWRKVGAIARA